MWQVDPDIQVVICTAFSDLSWDEVIARLGVQDKLLILKKPFDDCEISQAARALSEKRKLLNDARQNLETLQELVQLRTQELEVAHGESARLLTAISSALIGFDSENRIMRWNSAAERLFRVPAEQAIGNQFAELPIVWSDPAAGANLLTQLGISSDAHSEMQIAFEGEPPIIISISTYPILGSHSKNGTLLLANDISERRRLEQQLHQAQKLESVGQLANGIAHEINTPMQYIGDNVQFFKRSFSQWKPALEWLCQIDAQSAPQEWAKQIAVLLDKQNLSKTLNNFPHAIEDTEQGVSQVIRIVRAMRDFSNPGTESRQPISLNRTLESVLVVSESEWKHVANLETSFAPSLPTIFGFIGDLQQVFLSLIINAAQAIASATDNSAKGKGKIVVSTTHSETHCCVAIKDNGPGIPREIQSRVFDPFFTTKDVGKGTGQGLTTAYQIVVQKHSGKLWLESELGRGATFFVELPITSDASVVPLER